MKGHHLVILVLAVALGYMAWKHKKTTGSYV